MAPVERTYFAVQPPYENLERAALLRILEIRGFLLDDVVDLARRELIDLCVDNDVEAQIVAEDDPQDYPVRRPLVGVLPSWFLEGTGPIRVRWVDDWRGGDWGKGEPASDGAGDDEVGEKGHPGILIEVARTEVPVVLAVSRPARPRGPRRRSRDAPGGIRPEDREPTAVLLPQIVLWQDVLRNLDVVSQPSDDLWTDEVASALRASVAQVAGSPRAVFASCGPCRPPSSVVEIVLLVRLLQSTFERPSRVTVCEVCARDCESPGSLELHLDRPSQRALRLELQDHVDDAALVCAPCHGLLHGPSVRALRQSLRPACPSCRDRADVRPVAGGMLPPSEVADDAVAGGCTLLGGPMPQWMCVACGASFTVARVGDQPMGASGRYPARSYIDSLAANVAPTKGKVVTDRLGSEAHTDDMSAAQVVEPPTPSDLTRLAEQFRATNLRRDLDGIIFEVPGGFVEGVAKDGGGRLLVRAFVATGALAEVEEWVAAQPDPKSGVWTYEEIDAASSSACVVYERPFEGNDWSSDPLVGEVLALTAAWLDGTVATLGNTEFEVRLDPREVSPSSAWLVAGDEASFPSVDELAELSANGDVGVFDQKWTASKGVITGDLVLVYFMAPRKAVHFVARAGSNAFFSRAFEVNAETNVSEAQQWVFLTPLIEVEPIPFGELKRAHDGHLVLRGHSGKYLRPDVIRELAFVAKDPAQQALVDQVVVEPVGLAELPRPEDVTVDLWREIAGGALPLEAHVTSHILEPLLRHLLDGLALDWEREYRVSTGSVDLVLLDNGSPVAAVEVKRAMPELPSGRWSLGRATQQLRRYTDELGVPGVLIDANRILLFAVGEDEPYLQVERRSASDSQLQQIRAHLISGLKQRS